MTRIPARVEFECELSRRDVEVTWLRGSKVIRVSDEKYEIVKEGATHRLVVIDVDGKDDGEYCVESRNKTSTARLSVQGR